MKRILALLFVFATVLSLAACGGGGNNNTAAPPTSAPTSSAPTSSAPAPTTPPPAVPTVDPSNVPSVTDNPTIVVDLVRHSPRDSGWNISPWKNDGNAGNTIWLQLYSCLMSSPGYGTVFENMHYDIAESVTFSADKLTAKIKIRDYVRDSKGNPIKAEDVLFSYQTAPTLSPMYAKVNNLCASITATGEYTLEFVLKRYTPGAWESLLSYMPIVSKTWYEKASDEEKANDPATTGAYKVASNTAGNNTMLTVVDNFWQKDDLRSTYQITNVKNINYIAILEPTMRTVALETGELDSAFVDPLNIGPFLNNPDFNVTTIWTSNPNTIVLNASENSPFYNNPTLRKAVLHAVDWMDAAIPISGSTAVRGHDIAGMLCSDYDPKWNDEPYFEYDVELAKKLLAEAGYKPGELTLRYCTRNNPPQIAAGTMVQSYLKIIGIDLILDSPEQALYNTYMSDPTVWDMMWVTQGMPIGVVTESWVHYLGLRGNGLNASFVDDPELQKLLNTVLADSNPATRNAFRNYAIEMAYSANITNERAYYVTRKGVEKVYFNLINNPAINAWIFTDEY